MTLEQLSPERNGFSSSFIESEEDFSSDITLETYLSATSIPDPFISIFDDDEPQVIFPRPREKVLGSVKKRLAELEMGGKEHVEEYVRSQYRKGFMASTIRGSSFYIESFVRFMKSRGKGSIEEMERKDVEGYVEQEQDHGMKPSTVKLKLAGVKAFVRFLIEQGVVGHDVLPWKLQIRVPETLPRAMDPEDVDRLLATEGSVRDRAMILVLLRTGMRIGELLSTRVTDVNMEEQKILIYEAPKNRRGRVVYFGSDARNALKAWLEKRKQREPYLFHARKGMPLTYGGARLVFRKCMARAGLSHKGYTLHSLRHTFATGLLNAGMPLECLEKLLGHNSLEVTRRYARLSDKSKEESYFKAMAIIERSQRDGSERCDRELQAFPEETQLLPPHGQELHEHA
jgi:integrase/recombinase XerD